MIWLAAIVNLAFALAADAQSLHLILVPQQSSFQQEGQSKFDLYLINDSKRTVKVPSLESFTAIYMFRPRSMSGKEELAVNGTGPIFSHPLDSHFLGRGKVAHAVIEMVFKADVGDLVEVYVEIGQSSVFKSNSVLLLCSPPAVASPADPASSPRPTVTP